MKELILTSSAFKHNEKIPALYTCDGNNINPPLLIKGIPEEAKSLALIVDDPDAPVGTWDHWIKWNIDPPPAGGLTEIREATEPEGVAGKGSGGSLRYEGPCPPDGMHRYFFKVYALDMTLDDIPEGASKKEVERAMFDHIIAEGVLIGTYAR